MFANSNTYMAACFAVIGSIASSTRKLINNVEVKAIEHFALELKKLELHVDDLKITLVLGKGRFFLILFYKRVLTRWSDNLTRNDKTITKSFFSVVNMTSFLASVSVSVSFRKVLMLLSTSLIENASFVIFSLNDTLLNETLKNSKQLKTFKVSKWKSKPTLCFSEMKLLKLEYTPLNVGLW